VQKIVDTHFRMNRLAGVENNLFNFGLVENSTDSPNDDRIEVMAAQTRAWIEHSNSFDVLGRYEARLTRQLLQLTAELDRLQAQRRMRAMNESSRKPFEIKADEFELASFGRIAPELEMNPNPWRVLTRLPPPETSGRIAA
jgi:hypothetical protein